MGSPLLLRNVRAADRTPPHHSASGRTFRLDRIHSLTPTTERFLGREPASLMEDVATYFRAL